MVAIATSTSYDNVLSSSSRTGGFTVFVQHHGRWIRGCQFDSLDSATEQAADSFRRSGLDVEVRDSGGSVRFQQSTIQRAMCEV